MRGEHVVSVNENRRIVRDPHPQVLALWAARRAPRLTLYFYVVNRSARTILRDAMQHAYSRNRAWARTPEPKLTLESVSLCATDRAPAPAHPLAPLPVYIHTTGIHATSGILPTAWHVKGNRPADECR